MNTEDQPDRNVEPLPLLRHDDRAMAAHLGRIIGDRIADQIIEERRLERRNNDRPDSSTRE